MFLVFEIRRRKRGKDEVEEVQEVYSNGEPLSNEDADPSDSNSWNEDIVEVAQDENGADIPGFSEPDDDLDDQGNVDKYAVQIPPKFWLPDSGWNPFLKNAPHDCLWGKYNYYVRGLANKYCDFTVQGRVQTDGIRKALDEIQKHPQYSKLGGINCDPTCPKDTAAFAFHQFLGPGLRTTMLERLRNYRATAAKTAIRRRASRAKKLTKRSEKSKKQNSNHRMSSKDTAFIAAVQREAKAAAGAKALKLDKSQAKKFELMRKAQLKEVQKRNKHPT
jgi:hypothetical protein